ncbi:MAG: hypothetical protein M1837_002736 [Sclerophora amabilis]|nr:MAG: hypothetical protein M1837_002736 [Sclerophora amabilis]
MLTLFRTDWLNMWEDLSNSRLPLANPSLGLQLYQEVDAIFTQWEDDTRTEQQYVVCAEDLLGSHYNSLIHLDVELVFPPIFHRQHLSVKKTNVLLQILWGLFLHRPLVAFQNFYVDHKQAMPSRYIDRLASLKNKVRGKVLSRLSLFNKLVDILATTVPKTSFLRDGLLLLDQIYELAFGHLPMQKLKIETRHALVDHFQNPSWNVAQEVMVKIAKKKMQTFPLNKLFTGQGQHSLDSLFANRPPSGSRQKRGIKAIEDQPARSNQQRRIRQSQEPIPQNQTVADPSTIWLQFAPDPDLKGPLIRFNAILFQYLYHTFQVTKQILSCRATIIE